MEYSEVKELIGIFEKTDLNDMEVTLGNDRLRLSRGPAVPVAPAPPFPVMPAAVLEEQAGKENAPVRQMTDAAEGKAEPEKEPEKKKSGQLITAPIVGTFYQSQAPGEPPFVKVGDRISAGDVVCIIEAMKFMNEVNSEISGTVTEILVEDGAFVEYGQELFRVE